jgi:hypothetical protein
MANTATCPGVSTLLTQLMHGTHAFIGKVGVLSALNYLSLLGTKLQPQPEGSILPSILRR